MSNKYFPGQRIRCRGEDWQVTWAEERKIVSGGSVWEIRAKGLTGIPTNKEYCFMSDLEIDLEICDPSDIKPVLDDSKKAIRARLFLEAHLRRLLPRNGALYLGQHGAFDPYPFQLKPASIAINLLRPRLLIGDAVGIGKTIECGILLSELMRRGVAQRVLCAVPKAILEQFQNEMWGRFSIPFHRLDSKGLQRLKQDLPSTMNPFFHFEKVIISIDTLKLKNYQKLLEDCDWDVLIIDECHNVANRTEGLSGSLRHRVAKRLAERSRAVILMSATPHDGTPQGFASLIKLLDRTKIPNDENFTREDFQDHFIRRTRASIRDQLGDRKPRQTKVHNIEFYGKETDLLQHLHDIKFQTSYLGERKQGAGKRELFKTTLIKSLLSSPDALAETLGNKIKKLDKITESGTANAEKDAEVIRNLLTDIKGLGGKFSRLDHLGKFLKESPVGEDNRLVIFTERIATLNLLKSYLLKSGFVKALFDPKAEKQEKVPLLATAQGSTGDVDLQKIVKSFQSSKDPVHILIATNVASEGLNLHEKCYRLIHFDLPWSFITLEQRNGRIDRLGQKHQPEIHYFASKVTQPTRESDLKKLKDDFWIVRKLEARMKQASQDMDEDALAHGFSNGDDEEAKNTDLYEEGSVDTSENEPYDPLMASLAGSFEGAEFAKSPPKRMKLPTLFHHSPGEFVKGICKEISVKAQGNSSATIITIDLDQKMKHEVSHWPKEFIPQEGEIILESDTQTMAKYFLDRRKSGYVLEKSFLNEIHPAIRLLEQTAMEIYPGKDVPIVTTGGLKKDSIGILIQATLFNEINEVVFQTWQVLEFQKGKADPAPLIMNDNMDPDYIAKMVDKIRDEIFEKCKHVTISEHELKRIEKLAEKALSWVKDSVNDLRKKRAHEIRQNLLAEGNRIKKWEQARHSYLLAVSKKSESEAKNAGLMAQVKQAKEELKDLEKDTSQFSQFINRVLATNKDADLQILQIFVGI